MNLSLHRALLTLALVFAAAPLASAGEQLLAVAMIAGQAEIVLVKDDGELVNLSKNAAEDTFPCWSPDGSQIAFVSNRDGAYNVFVMDAAGGAARKITREARGSARRCYCPSWSPEGDKIAYQLREGNTSELITVELDGGRERRVYDNAWDPVWSPSGDKIVFVRLGEKGWELCSIEPDGGKFKALVTLDSKVGFIYPSVSPSGKQIAYTKPAGESFEVHVCDLDGANEKQVTKLGRMNTHSAWAADGKSLLVYHDVDGSKWRWLKVAVGEMKAEEIKALDAAPYLHGNRVATREGK